MHSRISLIAALTTVLASATIPLHAGETENKLTRVAKLLDGRNYVRMGKDITCKGNDPEHTELKSWANKISFESGQILIWGKVCNDSPESVAFSTIGKNLLISADLSIIVYKNEVLKYFKDGTKLCDAGLWCPVKQVAP